MARYVALIRGINVGGVVLKMEDLKRMLEYVGFSNVRTYIQSGNVIFNADRDAESTLSAAISARIAERFGLRVPVVLRSTGQMIEFVRHNPFLEAGAAEETLHVLFLAGRPSESRIDSLDPDRSPPDQFAVRNREVYLCLANGVAGTKLSTSYFDTCTDLRVSICR